MKVAFFPESWRENPYLDLLEQNLGTVGVAVEKVGSDYLSGRWLIGLRQHVQVLHFHWIQYHYTSLPGVASWKMLSKFVAQVFLARALGYRIVWTMHNVLPHEALPGNIDWLARWLMSRLSHAVLVLCDAGRAELARRFGRRKHVYTTPLGNYTDVHPSTMDQQQARDRLGLRPEHTVYLYFGGVRPHKGIEQLLRTFSALPGENLRLLVVGAAHSDDLGLRVNDLARGDPRISTMLSFVPEDKLQVYLAASDAVVLPFLQVMSSSSAMAAMSFRRPVIGPALGCLPEWIPADCGILYDPHDADGLRNALLAAQQVDLVQMGESAFEYALGFSWARVAETTLKVYKSSA